MGPAIHATTIVLWKGTLRRRPQNKTSGCVCANTCVHSHVVDFFRWLLTESRPIRKAKRHEVGRAFTAIYRANCYNANENMMLQILRFSVLSACYTGHLAALVYFQGRLRRKRQWHSKRFCHWSGDTKPHPAQHGGSVCALHSQVAWAAQHLNSVFTSYQLHSNVRSWNRKNCNLGSPLQVSCNDQNNFSEATCKNRLQQPCKSVPAFVHGSSILNGLLRRGRPLASTTLRQS